MTDYSHSQPEKAPVAWRVMYCGRFMYFEDRQIAEFYAQGGNNAEPLFASNAQAKPDTEAAEGDQRPEVRTEDADQSFVEMLWKWFEDRGVDLRQERRDGLTADDFKIMLDEHEAALIPAQAKPDTEAAALWMIREGYATGHGDTLSDLLGELVHQVHANALLEAHNNARATLGVQAIPPHIAISVQATPSGWQLVPIEPTTEMLYTTPALPSSQRCPRCGGELTTNPSIICDTCRGFTVPSTQCCPVSGKPCDCIVTCSLPSQTRGTP